VLICPHGKSNPGIWAAANQREGKSPKVCPAPREKILRFFRRGKSALDLDTPIHRRWAMRDVRGKRTKMLPVSEIDLAALTDLGFVEVREGLPRLTGLGILALD
jgi:hypothetical protein